MITDKQPWQQLVKDHCEDSAHPVVVVLGPTASGKTAFSIELAMFLGGEVLNGDSRQLYRDLNIGTAKITLEEMQAVPHHLFDVLAPSAEATVGWYQKEAHIIIDSLHTKNVVPIVVGGSMLYISALTDGLSLAPPANPEIRDRIEREYDKDDGVALHSRLVALDPEIAARIHQNNKPRLVRAIEILETSTVDNPKEEMWKAQAESKYNFLILGIRKPREESVVKINNRCKAMFDHGWVEEVQKLVDEGYTASDPAMKSHGYKEIMEYIENGKQEPLEELQERIAAKTRQYARRQMTWWKRDDRIHWIDA
jgi:tRNA dimethylallyltransferase